MDEALKAVLSQPESLADIRNFTLFSSRTKPNHLPSDSGRAGSVARRASRRILKKLTEIVLVFKRLAQDGVALHSDPTSLDHQRVGLCYHQVKLALALQGLPLSRIKSGCRVFDACLPTEVLQRKQNAFILRAEVKGMC